MQGIIASVVGWPYLKSNYNALRSSYHGYVKNHLKKGENSPFQAQINFNKTAKKLRINIGVGQQPNRKAAKFTAEMAEKALREEEEERPAVAVQAKVFTMEIIKKKRKGGMKKKLRRIAGLK